MLAYPFTLVELLVVVATIVVLLALLTPAMDRAIAAAEQAVCGSQLHVFGSGIAQYAMGNRQSILSAVAWRSSPTASPEASYPHPLMVRPFGDVAPAQWNVEAMAPYVGGVVELTKTAVTGGGIHRVLKEPWYCPSNAADKTLANNNTSNTGELNGVTGDPYFDTDYSYFGGVDSWNRDHATRPDDLVGRQMGAGKVLMADTLFFYSTAGSWWLNHGENGFSVHAASYGGPVLLGGNQLAAIAGINKLLGDGSVSWKHRGEFNVAKLTAPALDLSEPWVSNVTGPNMTGSITYY
jgi:type II secretory pathway pseudopilin PulG